MVTTIEQAWRKKTCINLKKKPKIDVVSFCFFVCFLLRAVVFLCLSVEMESLFTVPFILYFLFLFYNQCVNKTKSEQMIYLFRTGE